MIIKFGKPKQEATNLSYDWSSPLSTIVNNSSMWSGPAVSTIGGAGSSNGSSGGLFSGSHYGLSIGGIAGSVNFNSSSDEWGTIRCDKLVVDGVKLHDLVNQLVEMIPVFIPPANTQILDTNPSIKTAYLEYCECKENLVKARNNLNLILQIVNDQPNNR